MRPKPIYFLLFALGLSAACQSDPARSQRVALAVSVRNRTSFAIDSLLLNVNDTVDLRTHNLRFADIRPGALAAPTVTVNSSPALVCAVRLYAKGAFLVEDAYVARDTTHVPHALSVVVSDSAGRTLIAVRDERGYRFEPLVGGPR